MQYRMDRSSEVLEKVKEHLESKARIIPTEGTSMFKHGELAAARSLLLFIKELERR